MLLGYKRKTLSNKIIILISTTTLSLYTFVLVGVDVSVERSTELGEVVSSGQLSGDVVERLTFFQQKLIHALFSA